MYSPIFNLVELLVGEIWKGGLKDKDWLYCCLMFLNLS